MQLKEIERVQDAPYSLAHADMIVTDVLFLLWVTTDTRTTLPLQ